ncbi:MAG TPA: type ISP restriction/modification enzyme [Anaerolineales bacterium]|nr:type ISP restriction/modification enzyme [Anaerolineales bacterium]
MSIQLIQKYYIEIDRWTKLRGVPAQAWEYRLGTYSAVEWILERCKEKKPKDPTIMEKFNTYKFGSTRKRSLSYWGASVLSAWKR